MNLGGGGFSCEGPRFASIQEDRYDKGAQMSYLETEIYVRGFNLVNAAVVCAILESILSLEPKSVITEPRYLKLVIVSSFCQFTVNLCVNCYWFCL